MGPKKLLPEVRDRSMRELRSFAWGPVAALILGIVPLVMYLSLTDLSRPLFNPLPTMMIATYSAWILGMHITQGRPTSYRFFFFLYAYIFLGLAPITQAVAGELPGVAPWINLEDTSAANILILLGITCYELGYSYRRRKLTLDKFSSVKPIPWEIVKPRIYIIATLGVLGAGYYIGSMGISSFLLARSDFASIGTDDQTLRLLIKDGSTALAMVSYLVLLKAIRHRTVHGLLPRLLLTANIVMVLYSTNFISSPRYKFAVVLACFLLPLGVYANRKALKVLHLGAVIGLVYLFPAIGSIRRTLDGYTFSGNVFSLFTEGDYDSYAQIVNTVTYVREIGHTNGNQTLGSLLFWIPRSLWPGKPEGTAVIVAEYSGYSFTNISIPLWAEVYIDFGLIGVVAAFFIFGSLSARGDNVLRNKLMNNVDPYPIHFILPVYSIILFRGALMAVVPLLFVSAVVMRVVHRKRVVKNTSRYLNIAPVNRAYRGLR